MAALIVSIIIETRLFLIHAGRVSSVDDVLLNTLGAALGATLTRSLRTTVGRLIPRPRQSTPTRSAEPAASHRP